MLLKHGLAGLARFAAASSGITVHATTSASIASGTGTTNITIPGTPQENDIVEVVLANDSFNHSALSGYTTIYNEISGSVRWIATWKRMGSTPDSVVAVPQMNGNAQSATVRVIRGVNTTTAIDVQASAPVTGTSNAVTPPAVTTTTNNALVTIFAALDDDTGVSVSSYPSGYSDGVFADAGAAAEANMNHAVASKLVPTAGTETPGALTFAVGNDAVSAFTWAWRAA